MRGKSKMYRYRNDRSTLHNRDAFDRILPKLGRIKEVRGYRYLGRYQAYHEAVLVKGTKGSARFGGLLWGYGGEGPRGLVELLVKLGVHRERAEAIAFRTPRHDYNKPGSDWVVYFLPSPNRKYCVEAVMRRNDEEIHENLTEMLNQFE
jgi:hypothetical protein